MNSVVDLKVMKKLEEIVDLIGDNYDPAGESIVRRVNELTNQNWDGEDLMLVCAEYWSHHSVEETAYMLAYGEYPNERKVELCFWKEKQLINMTDEEIWLSYRLGRRGPDLIEKLEVLPITRILQWIEENLLEFEREPDDNEKRGIRLRFYDFSAKVQKKYGFEERICFSIYNEQLIKIHFENISDENMNSIIRYLEGEGCKKHQSKG